MPRMRIGDMLVRAKLIDEMQLSAALAQQRQWGGKLGDILVDQGFLDEMMLWLGLSKQLDVPLVQLPDAVVTPDLLKLIPVETCEKLEIFPLARDKQTLTIATSDPNNIGALDEVAFRTGLKVKTVLAPHREVLWATRYYYRGDRQPCPPPRLRRVLDAVPPLPQQTQPPPPQTTPPMARPNQTPLTELASARTSMPPFAIPTGAPGMGPAMGPAMGPGASQGFAQPPGTGPGATGFTLPPPTGAGGSAEEQLRQANDMLRVLVELCIQRGVFTREELWQRLTTKR